MPWLPDDVWMAQKLARQVSGGAGRRGGGMGGNEIAAALMSLMTAAQQDQPGKGTKRVASNAAAQPPNKKAKIGAGMPAMPKFQVKQEIVEPKGKKNKLAPQPKLRVQTTPAAPPVTWKTQLVNACQKKLREPITKGDILYQTEEVEEGSFVSAVASQKCFSGVHQGQGETKKEAEEEAAKTAMHAEFPDFVKKPIKVKQELRVVGSTPRALKGAASIPPETLQLLCKPSIQWRQRLIMAFKKLNETVLSSEELVYTMKKLDGNTGFTCTVASPHFKDEYTCGKQSSRAKANEAASKIAFQREFPAIFGAMPQEVTSTLVLVVGDPKAELQTQWARLLGRPLSKEDIEYSFDEQGEYIVPSLTLRGFDDEPQRFTAPRFLKGGEENAKKKQAIVALVKKAMTANKETFEAKESMPNPKKEAEKARFKAKIEALSEAKKLAKAAKAAEA